MQTVVICNAIVTINDVDFVCPKCNYSHEQKDYYKKLNKSKKHYIHMNCKKCKTVLGVSKDIKGDVQVWLKEKE